MKALKVLRIDKQYRNADVHGHIIVMDFMSKEEYWEEAGEDWCEREGGGANYGYTYQVNEETDPKIIAEVLAREADEVTDRIDSLKKYKLTLVWYQNNPEQVNSQNQSK